MKNVVVRIGWHNALQDLPAKHPRVVMIKRSIKYRHLQFLTCALLALCNCTVAHAQNNNNFSGSGRGLLEVYWGWTDAASAGDQEEVY